MKKPRGNAGSVSEEELHEAIAVLIASTKRVKRKLNLVEIAEWLVTAQRGLGSLRAVAETVSLSEEMLRQFATVRRLSPAVQRLVVNRQIDSVDIAHRLSKLRPVDQIVVARRVAKGELDSDHLRAIISLRKSLPKTPISDIIERATNSRNIKEYVAQFAVASRKITASELRSRFARVVGQPNIRSLTVESRVGMLAVNSEGKKRLQAAAKRKGLTKRSLIDQIVSEGGEVTR